MIQWRALRQLIQIIFIRMQEENKQAEDYVMRDDVLLFSSKLSQSGHNIKDYRKRQKERGRGAEIVIPNSTESTYLDNNFVHTIDLSERRQSELQRSQEKIKFSIDKMPAKRISITAGNTRRRVENHENIKTQIKFSQMNQSLDHKDNRHFSLQKSGKVKSNKFATIERQFNRGPLKQKYLEEWLNAVLLQACYQQKFDLSIENPALKKFSLDRNSLLSKGIKMENLNRIYKSLFVYSMGFNNLLKEICGKSMQLRKTLWKVYAVLLEYSAEGQFETMIAEIERDRVKKMDTMKKEIEKRQKIIENNEQINEEKNAHIYKQIKFLKEENANLKGDKEVLLEEYKQAEQAFNQQVSMRLKFENKINEIHGVYSEVKSKHERLILDHQSKIQECKKLKIINEDQSQQISTLNFQIQQANLRIQELEKRLNQKTVEAAKLEIIKVNSGNQEITLKNRVVDLENFLNEKKRIISQLETNLENSGILLDNEKDQHKITRNQFEKSLHENNKLHQTIHDQMKQLNVLMAERRDFGIKSSQVEASVAVFKEKLQERERKVKEQQKQISEFDQATMKMKNELEHQKSLKMKFEESLTSCYENISKMKAAKYELQQRMDEQNKKIAIIDEILDEKDKIIYEKSKQLQNLNQENAQNLLLLKTQESKLSLLTERMNSELQLARNKFSKLKEEHQLAQKRLKKIEETNERLTVQHEKYKTLYEETANSLKDEKFERGNLDLRYKQSLVVMQSENEHIKHLTIKISELNEQIMAQNRKITAIEYVSKEKEKLFERDRKFWETQLRKLQVQNKQKKHHIHPLIYEDIAANYLNIQQLYSGCKLVYETKIIDLEKKLKETKNTLEQVKSKNKTEEIKKQKEFSKQLERKKNQVEYANERLNIVINKNKELEEKLNEAGLGTSTKVVNAQQQKYLQTIKQKSNLIDDYAKQLEKAHDDYSKLKQNYSRFQEITKQNQQRIQNFERQNEKLRNLNKKSIQEKEQLQNKIIELQTAFHTTSIELAKQSIEVKKRQQSAGSRNSGRTRGKGRNYQNESDRIDLEPDTKRNDFVKKYRGAYMYYNK